MLAACHDLVWHENSLLFVIWLLLRGGLVVSVLAIGPTGYSVAGSNPTEDGGFLWVIKIPSTHFQFVD
jgi:hypothetical protein